MSTRARTRPNAPSRRVPWRAISLVVVHLLVLAHLAHWKLAGTTLTPVEPSEAMQTLELGWVNAGFVLLVVTILLTLVLGRFFCGWACHVVAYQDLCAWLLRRVGLRPVALRLRTLSLVPFVAAFVMFGAPTLVRLWNGTPAKELELRMTTEAFWQTFPGPGIAILTVLVAGFVIVWWLGSKGFCTYGCPYGAFFAVADRFAPLRIRVTDACDGSAVCTSVCTSNVRVHEEVARFGMVVDQGCMKCLDCVRSCPNDALYVGFGAVPGLAKQRRPRRTYDLSLHEEALAAATCLFGVLAFRGLAHQVPLLLAIGLGVVCSVASVVLLRLVRAREFKFQHIDAKRSGALTPGGRWLGVVCMLLLAGMLHSGFVRLATELGERHFVAAAALRGQERKAELAQATLHLERAARFAIFPDAALDAQLGTLAREAGDYPLAESRLQRAITRAPELSYAWLALAEVQALRGARAEAERTLRAVLDREPGFAPAAEALRKLTQR